MSRYKGRHRKPTTTGRRTAGVLAGGVLTAGFPAVAAEPARADILDEIARCESGHNPTAQNPSSTASGTFQFLDSTWRSIGGTGRAKDASPAEQRRMAEKLYAQQGTTPWNASKSCWGGTDTGVTPRSTTVQRTPVKATAKAAIPRGKSTTNRAKVTGRGYSYGPPPADLHRRDNMGRGTYVCDIARLAYDACDPDTLGDTVAYPLFDKYRT